MKKSCHTIRTTTNLYQICVFNSFSLYIRRKNINAFFIIISLQILHKSTQYYTDRNRIKNEEKNPLYMVDF